MLALTGVLALAGAACSAAARETALGSLPAGRPAKLVYDRRGCHVVWLAREADRFSVWLDGRRLASHPVVLPESLVLSPDGKRLAYVATDARPDRTGRKALQCHLVLDRNAGPRYDLIEPDSLTFSPDSRHVAYSAARKGEWLLLVDHKVRARSKHPFLVSAPRFASEERWQPVLSLDGSHVACVTTNGRQEFVLLDGRPGPTYDRVIPESLVFSPDSRHLAYVAKKRGQSVVVLDGKHVGTHKGILRASLRFGPDSRRIAYAATDGGQWFVVADHTPGPTYDAIMEGGPIFGSAGSLAYAAQRGQKWFVVRDGQNGPEFDGIGKHSITFSSDGARLAYDGMEAGHWTVVVDGQRQPEHDGIADVLFSPDSRNWAYSAVTDGKWRVVWNGVEGPAKFRGIGDLRFSPDSRHVAYFAGVQGGEIALMVDQQKVAEYDSAGQNGPWWRDERTLEFLGIRARELYRVTVTVER
jgi:hypothetical protein